MSLPFENVGQVNATFVGGVLSVTIDQPERRNPLSLSVLRRIEEVFGAHAQRSELRLGVVTGSGDKAFASGGDLTELAAVRTPEDALALSRHGKAALQAIRAFPVPVVARLNGVALGGGAELAIACDLRFAAAHARIGFVHSRLAISPSWGGGVDLMRLVGSAVGTTLLARGDILVAEEAKAIGLVDEIAPDGVDFESAFRAYTAEMRNLPPQVMRAIKGLSAGEKLRDRQCLDDVESDHFAVTWSHDDHWQAVAAAGRG